MPALSIIPAHAVADERVSDTQLRVLCAIGTFTSTLGGQMWASISTLAKQCRLSTRSVQRALPALIEAGYLVKRERPGRSTVYEVVLQGVTGVTPTPDTAVTQGGDAAVSPKRSKERSQERYTPEELHLVEEVWGAYPTRPEAYPYVPARKAIIELLRTGVAASRIVSSAKRYKQQCLKQGTEPRYVTGIVRFYRDGIWEQFASEQSITVYGRTRDEWARSGQDVSEFDRLASQLAEAGA